MRFEQDVKLGLEIGLSSIGWTLVREDPATLETHILTRTASSGKTTYALGPRIFKAPENPWKKFPL